MVQIGQILFGRFYTVLFQNIFHGLFRYLDTLWQIVNCCLTICCWFKSLHFEQVLWSLDFTEIVILYKKKPPKQLINSNNFLLLINCTFRQIIPRQVEHIRGIRISVKLAYFIFKQLCHSGAQVLGSTPTNGLCDDQHP